MPTRSVRDRLTFWLERWIQRGWLYQLGAVVGLIATIALAGGALAYGLSSELTGYPEAVWWAFLRLSDPGYLGDDEGLLLGGLSLVLTISGAVIFIGALVAIMTQWLHGRIRRLESGLTPIASEGHLVVLGWTSRTAPCVRELLLSEERARRFLRRKGVRALRVVVLAGEVTADLRAELREHVGPHWDEAKIILRSGTSLEPEDLDRVNVQAASGVVVPGSDFELGGARASDARVVKTLMTMGLAEAAGGARPSVVAEILDAEKLPVAEEAYPGDLELIASDQTMGRIIAQITRHRGLSYVFDELFSHERGSELYVRQLEAFAGWPFEALSSSYEECVVLGVVRPAEDGYVSNLLPRPGYELGAEDRVVFLAERFEDTAPRLDSESVPDGAASGFGEGEDRESGHASAGEGPTSRAAPPDRGPEAAGAPRRILLLGWNHKVPTLLEEYGAYAEERFEIDLLSMVPEDEQTARLDRAGTDRVRIHAHQGDYTREAVLDEFDLASYENVVLVGSERLDSEEATDARTILGFMLLQRRVRDLADPPEVLVELVDPDNGGLFAHRKEEMLVTPRLLSHMLAHVTLRPELAAVFTEICGAGGAEFYLHPWQRYVGDGVREDTQAEHQVERHQPGARGAPSADEGDGNRPTFGALRSAARRHGERAVGLRYAERAEEPSGGIVLNPPDQAPLDLGPRDEVLVLATSG